MKLTPDQQKNIDTLFVDPHFDSSKWTLTSYAKPIDMVLSKLGRLSLFSINFGPNPNESKFIKMTMKEVIQNVTNQINI